MKDVSSVAPSAPVAAQTPEAQPAALKLPETTRMTEIAPEASRSFEVSRVRRSAEEIKRIRALPEETEVSKGEILKQGRAALVADAPVGLTATEGTAAAKPVEFHVSEKDISLYLKSLTLNKSFDFSLFGPRANQIYVAAIAWDLSGKPPVVFPPAQLDGQGNLTYALRPLDKATFLGDGLQLWPSQKVVGGLHVQLVVMESDGDTRKLGEKLALVHDEVKKSSLVSLLAALASGPTAGTVTAALNAGAALTGVVAELLKKNGDDLVAVFHGTYGAELMRESQDEHYDQRGASIDLAFHAR